MSAMSVTLPSWLAARRNRSNWPAANGILSPASPYLLRTIDPSWTRWYPDTPPQPFRAPDTWNAHRRCPASCKCSRDNGTEMDPLVAAAYHNMVCSPLHSIPEELLLIIMNYLDISSIQCLRRASRLFLRLYCSGQFSSTHDLTSVSERIPGQHWLQTSPTSWPRALRREHGHFLARDIEGFCEDCRCSPRIALPRSIESLHPALSSLFCYGCEVYHPMALFPPTQRLGLTAAGIKIGTWSRLLPDRICIGRQGHVRLCSHKTITWDELLPWMARVAQMETPEGQASPDIEIFTCEHESHLPQNHGPDVRQNRNILPRVSVRRQSPGKEVHVVLEWEGHLQIDNPSGTTVSATALRRQLEPFRESVVKHIAPEIAGRLPEMGCLDPNRCVCLPLEGREVLRGWAMSPPQDLDPKCCRLSPQSRLNALQPASTTLSTCQTTSLESLGNAHHTVIQTTGVINCGTSLISINIDPCSHDRCLSIRYSRSIAVAGTEKSPELGCVTMAWCQALEPESYNLMGDEKSFGVSWCRTTGCPYYHEYGRKAVANPRNASRWYGVRPYKHFAF